MKPTQKYFSQIIKQFVIILCVMGLILALQEQIAAVESENNSKQTLTLKKIMDTIPKPEERQEKQERPAVKKSETLKEVVITGNVNVPTSMIRGEIILFKGDVLNPFKIRRTVQNLRSLGLFLDIKTRVTKQTDGQILYVTVKENPSLERVKFVGNNSISSEELKKVILSQEGDLLNLSNLRSDIKSIEDHYQKEGFILSKIYQIKTPSETENQLTFYIAEGTLEEISITGNTKTKDFVIRREMDSKTGESIQQKNIKRDLQRIFNLNYFSKLEPDFKPSDTKPHHYKLQLEVEEKSTGSINFGGGYGQQSGLFAYSDLNIDNVGGTGQLLALRGQWGKTATSYQFKYHNPWMWDVRRSFTFRAWKTQGSLAYVGTGLGSALTTGEQERDGYDFTFGVPVDYQLRTSHQFKWEHVRNPEQSKEYNIRSYQFGVSYDTRDVMFNPREGVYYVFTTEKGFKVDPTALDFSKHDLSLSTFIPTYEKQTIATRLMVGYMEGDIEPTERYYVGGPNTVRGYQQYPDSFANGKYQLIVNLEYRFLFSDFFQALMFVDWGWADTIVVNGNSERNPPYIGKVGKGVGMRITSPLGPIRLDFGVDDLNVMRIHFNIGQVF